MNKWIGIASIVLFISAKDAVSQEVPRIFGGNLNTDKVEYSLTISPDSTTIYFVKTDSFYISTPKRIYTSTLAGGNWSPPEIANFSIHDSDSSPFISPDGNQLFFTSKRPIDGVESQGANIWKVQLKGKNKGAITPLTIVNSDKSEYSPSVDKKSNLYFGSYRVGGMGFGDLWFSRFKNGKYQKPINLGRLINTPNGEWGSCISADGQFLIFENSGNKQNYSGAGDLYISQKINGDWQKPLHLPQPINSVGSDLSPKFHNGFLYYASNRNYDHLGNLDLNNVNLYSLSITNILHCIKN